MDDIFSNLLNMRLFYISQERYERHTSLSSHFHPFPVIMFVAELTGVCTYRIDSSTYNAKKGDLILCNPGTYHQKYLKEGSSILEYHIAFDNFILKGLSPDTIVEGCSHAVIHIPEHYHIYCSCFLEALEEKALRKTGFETVIKATAARIVAFVLRDLYDSREMDLEPAQPHMRINKTEMVEHLKFFLYQNYNKSIYLRKVARNMYITHVYLCRIFKEVTGETPNTFLIKIRLKKAIELLDINKSSLKEISKSVGYDDYYHFSKLFKKYYGVSPAEYRSKPYIELL